MIDNHNLNQKYANLSNNIKYLRHKMNITQEELAEMTDLSTSYIKQIESCKEYKNVTLNVMLKLSKAFDIELEDLFRK